MYPETLKYTKEHEWVQVTGQRRARVGVTFYAQQELGDVVFVDLPKAGARVEQGKSLAVVESVKAVSDVYAPVSGTVVEVNGRLADEPELVNKDPYGDGWICVLEMEKPEQAGTLMDSAAYRALIGASDGA